MAKNIQAYRVVYQALKDRIISERYEIGSYLPTEHELVAEFSVSRTTIRHALEMLANDGYVKATAGKGTEIIDYKTCQSLNGITSITETLRRRGIVVVSRSLYIDRIKANFKVATELNIHEGDEIIRVQRVQLADAAPIAIMKNYIPVQLVPNIENIMSKETSLYKCLEDNYSLIIEETKDRISARAADFNDAEILDIPLGEPLIAFARVCYGNGIPICVDHVSIVGKLYEFELTQYGRK